MPPQPPRNVRVTAADGITYRLDENLRYAGQDAATGQHRWLVYGPAHVTWSADDPPRLVVGDLPGKTDLGIAMRWLDDAGHVGFAPLPDDEPA